MLYLICAMVLLCVILCIITLAKLPKSDKNIKQELTDEITRANNTALSNIKKELADEIARSNTTFSDVVAKNQKAIGDMQSERLHGIETRFAELDTATKQSLDSMRRTLEEKVTDLQKQNNDQLEKMRATVDEKLQKTLEARMTESFKNVSEQLSEVSKGLGEMRTLATDVGGLKKVLSNVKTRGILGETQLGNILEQILSPEQYDKDVATIPNSTHRVEFAIKMPGHDSGFVYMPIDSKFPQESYIVLQDAINDGDSENAKLARKELRKNIISFAKDIRSKYVEVPYTTDFGVMFLPTEGLYAEAVSMGVSDELQQKHKIMIAGPSNMAAFLNTVQMGFRSIAIQKKSAEVWDLLSKVKTEFERFSDALTKTQGNLQKAQDDLEKLVGTRTNKILSALKNVETLDTNEENLIDGE